jgi:hypothetical protein
MVPTNGYTKILTSRNPDYGAGMYYAGVFYQCSDYSNGVSCPIPAK